MRASISDGTLLKTSILRDEAELERRFVSGEWAKISSKAIFNVFRPWVPGTNLSMLREDEKFEWRTEAGFR